jgi:type IV pilus assembly protein PilA
VLSKIRKMLKHQEGFTLVELMIVVVILGILAGIGIQQYGNVQEKAKENAHEANVRMIKSAIQMYEMLEEEDLEDLEDLTPDYLEEVPVNPKTGELYDLSDFPES